MPTPSKRQILDTCNMLFQTNPEKYFYKLSGKNRVTKTSSFNTTAMANDFIFQLCIEPDLFEVVLSSVMIWWSESTYNPEMKKYKA